MIVLLMIVGGAMIGALFGSTAENSQTAVASGSLGGALLLGVVYLVVIGFPLFLM
jgi:hypothetical protein